MKNALILHGKSTDSEGNWFPYLKARLGKLGYKVWIPDLPNSRFPKMQAWLEVIRENNEWKFNSESVIVGHSAGSVTAVQLLSELNVQIRACFLVGTFTKALIQYDDWRGELKGLFDDPIDYDHAREHAKKIVVVHSPEDPHCPLEQAKEVANKLKAELVLLPGGHFDVDDDATYTEFPALLEIIKKETRS